MVQAYILLTVCIGKMNYVFNILNNLDFVEEIVMVTGPCDLIIKINAKDFYDLKEVVLRRLSDIDGIMESSTSLVLEL